MQMTLTICLEMRELKSTFDIQKIFNEWSLFVNQDKTEFVEFNNNFDAWKSHNILGSLVDTSKDVERRIILANVAFAKFSKVWSNVKININRRIQIYDAQVLSVLLYNCSCWALTKRMLDKIDKTHRRRLRHILKIRYPKIISNESYKLTNTCSLSENARWSMLGHVLRFPGICY